MHFFNKEYLKQFPIKIILFVLQIELYFFVNGLFYNEDYITEIFELKKILLIKNFGDFLIIFFMRL